MNETLYRGAGLITFSSHANAPWCLRFLACLSLGFRGLEHSSSGHITVGSVPDFLWRRPKEASFFNVHHGSAVTKIRSCRCHELNCWGESQRPYR